MLDNKPSSADPDSPAAADDQKPVTLVSSPSPGVPRQSVVRGAFAGSDGIFVLPRWLLYLIMAWCVFQLEGWLVVSFQSSLIGLRWQFVVETAMALAAIVPGFVMARIERRPFGEFGLPARRAFGRNFWTGTL